MLLFWVRNATRRGQRLQSGDGSIAFIGGHVSYLNGLVLIVVVVAVFGVMIIFVTVLSEAVSGSGSIPGKLSCNLRLQLGQIDEDVRLAPKFVGNHWWLGAKR